MTISDQINGIINNIAEKLGIAIEYVYPILRKQAMIEGICGLLFLLITVVVFCIFFKKAVYHGKLVDWQSEDIDKDSSLTILYGFFALLSIVVLFVTISNFKIYITALINPDWYIINNMLRELIK